jgi:hypothetical protein
MMKIFLSYAHEDKDRVLELYRKLNQDGYDAWIDDEKLLPGQDWDLEINKAIKASDAIILCLTNISIQKEGYVQREIKKAIDIAQEKLRGNIFIIPARLDECIVPEEVSRLQYVDLFSEGGYKKLLGSLKLKAARLPVPTSGKITRTEPEDQNHPSKLIRLHEIAEELYEQAYAALQENQEILTPALQGIETPQQAIQKMVGVFHRQKSRGFFRKHEAYLREALQRYDPNDDYLQPITNELVEIITQLVDIFYSYAEEHNGRLITKSNILRKEMFLGMDVSGDLKFFGRYLEGIRIRVENISRIVGKLSAMIE